MKNFLKTFSIGLVTIIGLVFLAQTSFASIGAGFTATSTDKGFISPTPINGNTPSIKAPCFSTDGVTCITSGGASYPFPAAGNSTTTLTNFLGGIGATTISATSTATSTIANANTVLWVPTDYATNGCAGDPTKTDFGSCVNALNAKLVASGQVGGQIMVPDIKVTQAQWQTPINFSGPVIVSFDCVQGAQLQYGGTATSTLFNMSNPTGHLVLSDDYGCIYMGHSTLIAQGGTNVSTTVGVGFGGNNGAVNVNFHDNSVNGFGHDIQIGQNAYMVSIVHNAISGGNGGLKGDLLYNDQSSNSGEALTLTDDTWTDPANNVIGNDLYFGNGSLASADISGKSLDDTQIFIGSSNGTVSIHDLHIENSACQTGAYNQYIPILGVSSDQFTHINFNNIEIANDCSGSQTFVTILSHGGQLYASGIHVDNYGGGTITNLVLHSLDNGLEAETVCKVDVASGGLTNIIGGSGAQAYSLAAGNTCVSDTSNSYAISIQAHQNNIATIENGSQDVGTFDNNGKWTFLSGINALSTSATNSIGGSLFGGAAPIAGLGTSNSQFVISQNVNNLARQLDLANINMGANAEGGITFENGNSTNGGAASTYIGGLVMGGPNFNTAGFGGLAPNGMALFNTDGRLDIGAISSNAASSTLNFYAGNNGSFAGGQPDMTLTGGTANLGVGTTTPATRFGLQGMAGGSIPMVLISTSTSAFATSTVFSIDKNGNVNAALNGATLALGTTTAGCLNTSSTGLVYSASCAGGGSGTVGTGTQGQFPFYNAGGTTLTATSTLFISQGGNIGIGSSSPTVELTEQVPAINVTREKLAQFNVSDDPSTVFLIGNGTTNNGVFSPAFIGFQGTDVTKQGEGFIGELTSGVDSGSASVVQFNAREMTGDVLNGTTGSITTRPLFDWDNNGTAKMTMTANGFLGIGTTTPTAVLSIDNASSTAGTSQTTPFGQLLGMAIDGVERMVESFDYYGHQYFSGPAPTVSGGTSSMNSPSNDNAGSINVVGTALTSVTMTFAHPWLSAPSCQEGDNVLAVGSDVTSISSTQVVFGFGTGGVSSATIWYRCTGVR